MDDGRAIVELSDSGFDRGIAHLLQRAGIRVREDDTVVDDAGQDHRVLGDHVVHLQARIT